MQERSGCLERSEGLGRTLSRSTLHALTRGSAALGAQATASKVNLGAAQEQFHIFGASGTMV